MTIFSNVTSRKFSTCAACVLPLLAATASHGQTRIVPPSVGASLEGRGPEDQRHAVSTKGNVEIPIPVAAVFAMPFIHAYGTTTRISNENSDDSKTEKDLQLSVGLLHHASEGAPVWKFESGRAGRLEGSGFWMNRGSLNLEKIFPQLRPNNSDKLDAWLGVYTLLGKHDKTYAIPDVGWNWISTSGFLFDFNLPYRFRIGYQDRDWMGAIAWRHEWHVYDDDTRHAGFRFETKRFVMAEAGRQLSQDIDLLIAAGVKLPNVATSSLMIRWIPKP